MRVITGSARGQKLKTLDGYDIRPTTDAVKEAIFSAIQFEIEGGILLDLFSGSGQLGIEGLSRGAKKAYFVDNNKECIDLTRSNVRKTGFTEKAVIFHLPNMTFLKRTDEIFDIAFLDPPYDRGLIQKTLPLLVEKMSDKGIIICEHEKKCRLPDKEGSFYIYKTYKRGNISATVYRKREASTNEISNLSG